MLRSSFLWLSSTASILHLVPYKDMRGSGATLRWTDDPLCSCPRRITCHYILMFAALILLYEVALAVARYVIIARDSKAALKWSREDYEQHELDKSSNSLYFKESVVL